jgi:hypothetical protein
MSTDRISVAILEDFIKKVRLASKNGHKEIKFSINELENICHNLSLISLRLLDREQKTEVKAETEVISVVMDGGGFEEKR